MCVLLRQGGRCQLKALSFLRQDDPTTRATPPPGALKMSNPGPGLSHPQRPPPSVLQNGLSPRAEGSLFSHHLRTRSPQDCLPHARSAVTAATPALVLGQQIPEIWCGKAGGV